MPRKTKKSVVAARAGLIPSLETDADVSRSRCQNCGQIWEDEKLHDISHYHERVAPGEIAPSGECPDPECGALCHPYPATDQVISKRSAIPFDGDVRDAALDVILDHALLVLYPYLDGGNHGSLALLTREHLKCHLGTELAVVNGSMEPDIEPSPMVKRLRAQFVRDVEGR